MLIKNEIEIARIRKKLNDFFDLDLYSDFLFLTFEEFLSKYGCFGFSFHDYSLIRFYTESGVLTEIANFLPENEYYVISLMKDNINFYKVEKKQMPEFLEQNHFINFVIFEISRLSSIIRSS